MSSLTQRLLPFLLVATLPSVAATQSLAPVDPKAAGLSDAGIARLDSAMQAYIDAGKLPGIVIALARNGRLAHWKAFGLRSVEAGDPMEPSDLFRIYSMTKPITSTAVMMLVESGTLGLDEPVSKYVPAFGDVRVWAREGPVTPHRPMTVRDLLRHTSGLTYGLFGETPVDSLYRKANLTSQNRTLDQLVAELARLPLVGHPGEAWNYSYSTDVLGRLVEIASGMPLDRFFEERIFRPLGMGDSFFEVPAAKRARFAGYYARLPTGRFLLTDSPDTGTYTRPPPMFSGGGGLVSSTADYLRFAQMILNGGELDGVRLLKRETVAEMLRSQIAPEQVPIKVGGAAIPGTGFGLGFSVVVDSLSPPAGPIGRAGWGGYANTFFWVDPRNRLIAVIMTQFFPFQAYPIEQEFRQLVYEALVR
jgi:CubicO group peptidase (beta-lactamase class C family)